MTLLFPQKSQTNFDTIVVKQFWYGNCVRQNDDKRYIEERYNVKKITFSFLPWKNDTKVTFDKI